MLNLIGRTAVVTVTAVGVLFVLFVLAAVAVTLPDVWREVKAERAAERGYRTETPTRPRWTGTTESLGFRNSDPSRVRLAIEERRERGAGKATRHRVWLDCGAGAG